ncbi:hemolysin family protein [Arthrobacter sp. 3Tela_A]|uniref:hemolysin family protein n=1 Tax=Arthrobacter sp. 3Tela_A TaxID=3093743 RepID=UPI003BB52A61
MEWLFLLAGLLLICGTGFFVAVEFSLVALDQPTVRRAVEDGDTRAEPLLRCLTTLSTQLSSCQLGITLTTLLTGYVMEPSVGRLLQGPLASLGLPPAASLSVSVVAAMVLATLLSMLLGELIPKNMSIALPFKVGRLLARPQLAFTFLFKPAILVLNGFSNKVLNLFGLEAKEEVSGARTPAELSSMVRRSAEMGTLDAGTANFLARTLSFSERTAADVMTPRIRLETIDADQPVSDVIEAARRTGYSRFPILGDSPDDIRGVVHVKKAVAVPRRKRAELPAAAIMSDILRVPETVHLDSLLSELRSANLQLAVVLDEYGGTAGVATLEDLVEEIVGEVSDEHDKLKPGVLQSASGYWYFPGIMRPDEVSDLIPSLHVPDDSGYETVGGYIMAELGRIAEVGDTVPVPGGMLEVERMDGRRIDRVCFVPGEPDQEAETEAESTPSGRQERAAALAGSGASGGSGGSGASGGLGGSDAAPVTAHGARAVDSAVAAPARRKETR